MKKKSHNVAFIFSFFLPGAGLWYLGKWKLGFINLGVVLALGIILSFVLPDDTFSKVIRWVAIGCAGGSGGLAQTIAQQMNARIKAEESANHTPNGIRRPADGSPKPSA
ncbi:MAG: hypothetical protein V1809_14775 [Planctomycetota bacterium]